jgi:hypothetical protein
MSAWCKERHIIGYGPKIMNSQICPTDSIEKQTKSKIKDENSLKSSEQITVQTGKTSSIHPIDFIEDNKDLGKLSPASVKSSELAPAQTSKRSSVLSSDILEKQNESKGVSDMVGLDLKKDKHISNMCSGKPTEGVPLNHKLGTVAKVVEDTMIDKDPLKIDHEGGPAMKAVINLNHTKDDDEIPPLSEYDMDNEVNESIYKDQDLVPDNDIIESGARSSFPVQANETSNKSLQTGNSSRKGMKIKRKQESIQLSAILPDDIWITNHNDPVEKVYYNINSNNVSPKLSDIEIDVPMEKVSLMVSESVVNLPNIKIEISQNAKEAQSDISEVSRQGEKVSLNDSESMGNKQNDENLNDPVDRGKYLF